MVTLTDVLQVVILIFHVYTCQQVLLLAVLSKIRNIYCQLFHNLAFGTRGNSRLMIPPISYIVALRYVI